MYMSFIERDALREEKPAFRHGLFRNFPRKNMNITGRAGVGQYFIHIQK